MRRIVITIAVAVVCALSSSAPAVHAQNSTDRYLVVFKADTVPADTAARIAASGGTVVRTIPEIGVAVVAADTSAATAIGRDNTVMAVGGEHMFGLPPVRGVEVAPDTIGPPTAVDAYYKTYQWDIRRIGAPAVWARGPVSTNTPRVAVLDVGVMDTHPDLAGQVDNSVSTAYCSASGGSNNTAGYPIYTSFIDFDTYPEWTPGVSPCTSLGGNHYEWHGTHVAGTVAAKFGGGRAVGVAPDARVGAYKVFDIYKSNGGLYVGAFDTPIFQAIIDATYRGYRVVSMSLGSNGLRNDKGDNASWLAWDRVTKWANRHGVVVVAAAGNAGLDLNGVVFNLPSDLSTVMSVSATGATSLITDANGELVVALGADALASYSNYGSPVDIGAPGGDCLDPACTDIRYLILNDGISSAGAATYYLAAGTSMATPHVSAVSAYVLAIHPDWTPGHVRSWLKQTAQPIGSRQFFGAGLLDADAATR